MIRNSDYILDNVIIGDKRFCRKAQCGVDLTVKDIYSITNYGSIYLDKTLVAPYKRMPLFDKDNTTGWMLKKGTYIVILNEGCQLSKNDTGYIVCRSSLNRNGCNVISGLWDPGYTTKNGDNDGNMNTRLVIDNKYGLFVEKNARICQFIIFENENPSNLYCGQFQNGKQR